MRSFQHRCPNPGCRAVLSIPDSARGKTVICARCGQSFFAPILLREAKDLPKPPHRYRKAG
jgi:hypothetical protein